MNKSKLILLTTVLTAAFCITGCSRNTGVSADTAFPQETSITQDVAFFSHADTAESTSSSAAYFNADIISAPAILQNYSDCINSGNYTSLNQILSENLRITTDIVSNYTDTSRGISCVDTMTIAACCRILPEQALELSNGYQGRYENEYHNRQAYLVLIDYKLKDGCPDTQFYWNGNRHEILYTGLDAQDTEVIYDIVPVEHRPMDYYGPGGTLLATIEGTDILNRMGLNLRQQR